MVCICIYSHSDYFDILQIQLDYVKSILQNVPCQVYLFLNKPYTMSGGRRRTKRSRYRSRKSYKKKMRGGQQLPFKTILYDETAPYFTRLLSCIKQIDATHFILTHDNDILIKFDIDTINKIVESMKINAIDSLRLQHDPENQLEIKINDTVSMSKLRDNDMYSFNVQPRIWSKDSAIALYSTFPDKQYIGTSSEGFDVLAYAKEHQKNYILFDAMPIQSARKFICSSCYCYIHLTSAGKLILYSKDNPVDPIVKAEQEKIYEKYLKSSKRGIDTTIW